MQGDGLSNTYIKTLPTIINCSVILTAETIINRLRGIFLILTIRKTIKMNTYAKATCYMVKMLVPSHLIITFPISLFYYLIFLLCDLFQSIFVYHIFLD